MTSGGMSRGRSDDLMCMDPRVVHEMPCPHCGGREMADDQAGGLHCPNCGHVQQMGWDDPESWMEGKFDWDFNLPLEGMSELDEFAEPGEHNWVIPTRHFGPRHHGGIEEWDTTTPYEEEPLYHGTTDPRALRNIQSQGFQRGFLTSEPKEAVQYAGEDPEGVVPFRVRLERPLHITGHDAGMDLITGKLQQEAQRQGYDGLVIHRDPTPENPMEPSQEWGEHRHVIPLDMSAVTPARGERVRTGSTRSLYHGTLLDHLPSIQQHGLLPEVGPFVQDAYDLNEPSNFMAFSPEEIGVQPAVFMTDKKRLEKALNAIRFNVAQKLNKRWSDVTPLDVRNHGMLLKNKGEMGAQDPPINYVWDEQHEEPFEEGPRAHQPRGVGGEGPYQAEPGDYYSQSPVEGLEPIHGPAMMRVFERQGLIPWWDPRKPGQGSMPDAAKEVYGGWHFAMPVTPEYWKQRPADFALYHGTSPSRVESIMQHGLQPWDTEIAGGNNYEMETPNDEETSWLTPRPGHVYMSQNPHDAHDRGLNAEIGGLMPGDNVEEYLNRPVVFKVDPRKLDPQHINPDEDFMLSGGSSKPNNQEEYPEYDSLGDMAERFGWGDMPSDTERVLGQGKSIGYRGVIPPEALTPGKYGPGGWTPLERTSAWQFEAASNPRKFFTSAQDHERGKRRWGFPKPRALGKLFHFKRSAVDPEWLQKWIAVNGPYMTHQTDTEATRKKIEQEGLIPHDQGPGTGYTGALVPRANHSYLARNLKALSAYSQLGESTLKNSTVAVDLRKLDPNSINPDEDAFDPNAAFREGDKPALRGQLPHDVPWWKETRSDEPSFPGEHGVVADGNHYANAGEWADKNGVTQPHHTAWSMNTMGHAAIEGGVHPGAIVPVEVAQADLRDNWPQVPLSEGYGASHTVVPIAQPAEAQRAASLIGDMRDGFGRFATSAPWEWGKWGRGLYFPETGAMHTWGDDRTHPEVALEDEHAMQGDAHHFLIRPNGTVKDQGAMNQNFENTEGDVAGLAHSLRELDPRLRLDKPSDWDFGATEPMEEEPSAVSRGEEGGHDHGVQTGNDFAGSL